MRQTPNGKPNGMPYSVVQRAGRWCVIKDDDNTLIGCHNTPREAYAQIAAIEASEGTRATYRIQQT